MKLKIDRFEIEIKVKDNERGDSRFNKEATMNFLNKVSLMASSINRCPVA